MTDNSTLLELKRIDDAISNRRKYKAFLFYKPYPTQLKFHEATHKERMLKAGNQLGKTLAAGNEIAYHATGYYPDWWKGVRYEKPLLIWVAGVSKEGLRDGAQSILLGPINQEGTGTIPKEAISSKDITWHQHDCVDFMLVRYKKTDAKTIISFKSYDQERTKFQAAGVNLIWLDEEPPMDIYSECLARTTATKGRIMITFTPLKGMSDVVKRYLLEPDRDRFHINLDISEVAHLTEEEKRKVIASYPIHEREARAHGVPTFGAGKVFPIEESLVFIKPIELPNYIPRIGGIDFGYTHAFAAVQLAYDRDKDVLYLEREFRIKERTPQEHCMVLRNWGDLVFAWPHDGNKRDIDNKATKTLAGRYKKEGLHLTSSHATFPDGNMSVDAGISEMLERMQSGRFKAFTTCPCFLEEFRIYHRDEHSRLVKVDEDAISAARYAMMMRRKAARLERYKYNNFTQVQTADGAGIVQM